MGAPLSPPCILEGAAWYGLCVAVHAGITCTAESISVDAPVRRDSGNAMDVHEFDSTLTPTSLVSEVHAFRATISNPSCSAEDIKRAYGQIIDHAVHMNPLSPGFERAGVALKEAVCLWLDCQSPHPH
jgi:hypothetical protein